MISVEFWHGSGKGISAKESKFQLLEGHWTEKKKSKVEKL